ncbi:flagella synthesis protein FlgN [Thiorhodovibrio frisius]|uniref:FlgN protein n=1 Tax=Thiorhodovibrio frisius TaxID=631362 RepID=H8YZN6_9GAMM|nr:flagellar protein FlgN [Thiorhodovibrio frisius]EIC22163.1 FlgN protein [Thiorhodovibrio frisius]WPL24457.1 FlgN protein [Thiorhodovibrio frisius]
MSQHQAFALALEQAIDLTSQLETLLLEETAAVDGRDPEHLNALVENKQQVLEQIEQATATLQRSVEEAGQAFTPDGLEVFLRASDGTTEERDHASARWKRLRELAASCEIMNRANAEAVERSRLRVTTALKIIRGEDDNGNTYSAQGYSQSSTVLGRTLTQA